MPNQDEVCSIVRLFISLKSCSSTEVDEGVIKRFEVCQGSTTAIARVHPTGTLQVQGPSSDLRAVLNKLKEAIEFSQMPAESILIEEIKTSISGLPQRIPNVDSTIIQFVNESILCLESHSLMGCAILIGCASERAICLLIDSYAE